MESTGKISRNFRTVQTIRKKSREIKRQKKAIEGTIIRDSGDRRPYTTVKIEGCEITGMLDSGANVSCFGKYAFKTVNELGLRMQSLDQEIKMADGQTQAVVGKVSAKVEWKGKIVTMIIYIVPNLQQQLYLGVDFWDEFGIFPQVEEIVSTSETDVELTAEQMERLQNTSSKHNGSVSVVLQTWPRQDSYHGAYYRGI